MFDAPLHRGMTRWVADLNALYREYPALWQDDGAGFAWISFGDRDQSVIAYQRQHGDARLLFVFNFTPVPRENYRVGMPEEDVWRRWYLLCRRWGCSCLSAREDRNPSAFKRSS